MAYLTWSNEYGVGVEAFDNQHKKLIEIINELHSAMMTGKGREVLGKTFQSLVSYTKTHFVGEERLMQTHGYPDYNQHKAEHDKLLKRAGELYQQFEQGHATITIEVMSFLKDWLTNHIQRTDKNYTAFFKTKNVH